MEAGTTTDHEFKPGLFTSEAKEDSAFIARVSNESSIKDLEDLVITKTELSLRSCLNSANSGLKKFINFFKWIGNIVCYYIGGINFKKNADKDIGDHSFAMTLVQNIENDVRVPWFRMSKLMALLRGIPDIDDKTDTGEPTDGPNGETTIDDETNKSEVEPDESGTDTDDSVTSVSIGGWDGKSKKFGDGAFKAIYDASQLANDPVIKVFRNGENAEANKNFQRENETYSLMEREDYHYNLSKEDIQNISNRMFDVVKEETVFQVGVKFQVIKKLGDESGLYQYIAELADDINENFPDPQNSEERNKLIVGILSKHSENFPKNLVNSILTSFNDDKNLSNYDNGITEIINLAISYSKVKYGKTFMNEEWSLVATVLNKPILIMRKIEGDMDHIGDNFSHKLFLSVRRGSSFLINGSVCGAKLFGNTINCVQYKEFDFEKEIKEQKWQHYYPAKFFDDIQHALVIYENKEEINGQEVVTYRSGEQDDIERRNGMLLEACSAMPELNIVTAWETDPEDE